MIAMLGTLAVTLLLTALACAAGALLLVVPFVLGVDMAERRAFSTDRWGGVCLAGVGLGVAFAYVVHSRDWSRLLYLPALGVAWAGPGLLALLDPSQRVLGGPQGVHEH